VSPLEGSIARANRLLVLDDDPFIPRWIRKVAEHEGYDVSIGRTFHYAHHPDRSG
jgi:DNA-binding response OmpR family regulator